MSQWKMVFGDKAKTVEKFACTGCGAIDTEHSHAEGPANGLCKCGRKAVHVPSESFLKNYPRIKWREKR